MSSLKQRKGVIAIGAHPDDIELGCGASLVRLAREGFYILSVIMTSGKNGTIDRIDRHQESREALTILGCHKVICLNFVDTRTHLQLNGMIFALEDIIHKQIPSDIEIWRVYTMNNVDRHQDHMAVYQASIVACRSIPQILGYETPSTWHSFMPQVFESVTGKDFELKLKALSKHRSQRYRNYMDPEHLRTIAQFRGQQINRNYAEGFIVHKMIL